MFKLTFKTNNAAFDDDYKNTEAARCLTDVVKQLSNGFSTGPVIDYNGNKIGNWSLT